MTLFVSPLRSEPCPTRPGCHPRVPTSLLVTFLQGWRPHTPLGLPASLCPPSRPQRSLHLWSPPNQSITHTSNQEVMVSISFLGRNHNCLAQRNWLLTQAVLDLLLVGEFVGASPFQVIQVEKNVKVSLPLALARYPPERCRAGRGYEDRSFLVLIESRCPMSKTGTSQGVLLVWSLLACDN